MPSGALPALMRAPASLAPPAPAPATAPRGVGWAVVAALVLGCAVAGARGLYRPDEGRYTAVALRMLQTGDWLDPQIHHDTPHLTKPPLTYWVLAASLGTLGSTTFAARLPNALALAGTVLLLALAGRRLTPSRPWLPASLYALSAFPRIAAGVVTTDTLLVLWTTMAGVAFACWRFDAQRPARWLRWMWVALALGFMTKGPPALLPLLGILCFTAWQDGGRALLRLFLPSGLLLFVLLALPWFVAVAQAHPGLAERFLVHEVVDRVASTAHHRNPEASYLLLVYLPLLLTGAFPWLLDAWRGMGRALGSLRHPGRADGDATERFLLCWLLLPTLVLFISRSRLPLYLLQVFPPLLLLAAQAAPPTRLCAPRSALIAWVLVLVGSAAMLGTRWIPSRDDTRVLAQQLAAVLPFSPSEVVFLRKPHQGLALYLGCEVEEISLEPRLSESGLPLDTLAEELADHEPRRVLLVEQSRDPAGFLARAHALDASLELAGVAGEYAVIIAARDRPH